jgi:MFS family permease
MTATDQTAVRELSDVYGRHYRTGERAEDLTGHSRRWLLWTAWAFMVAISPLQYGFAILVPGLQAASGWEYGQTLWLLSLFVVCQAAMAVPAAWMHRSSIATPFWLVTCGCALGVVGLLSLAHAGSFAGAVLGYSVAGGLGAGMVYSTCLTTAARWFPDDRVATIGFVTGGFACGAVPIIGLVALLGPQAQSALLTCAAGVVLVVAAVAARWLQDPPAHWWPQEIDAQAWAVDHHLNRSIPNNMPAVRHYTPGEAVRTGVLPLIWLLLASITAVSLFGLAFVAGYAQHLGLGITTAGLAAAGLAGVNGVVRASAGHLSDRFGRLRVLAWVLALEGSAQFALVAAGQAGHAWAFVAIALLVGLGGGAFYAIFAQVVLEYFGDRSLVQNQAVVYSAKAAGGLVGIGGAVVAVGELGYAPVFLAAGGVALASALAVRLLRQPGRPTLPVRPGVGTPTVPASSDVGHG